MCRVEGRGEGKTGGELPCRVTCVQSQRQPPTRAAPCRWPSTLTVHMRAWEAGGAGARDARTTSKSGAFPSLTLQKQHRHHEQQQQQEQQPGQQEQRLDPLAGALVDALERLAAQAAGQVAAGATVVELRLAASGFAAAAAAAAPITRFFQRQAAPLRNEGQPATDQQQQSALDTGLGKPQCAEAPPGERKPGQAGGAPCTAGGSSRGGGQAVDLDSVSVEEQQRILAQIQRVQQQGAGPPARAAGGGGAPGRGPQSGKRKAADADARQPKITALLRSKT